MNEFLKLFMHFLINLPENLTDLEDVSIFNIRYYV